MAETRGPTIRHRRLADELRVLRGNQSSREIAAQLGWSHTRISRLEAGTISTPPEDTVTGLLDAYNASNTVRTRVLELVRAISQGGWWDDYRDIVPSPYVDLLSVEADASIIRSYDMAIVPPLLQIPDYSRAVLTHRRPDLSKTAVERLVDVATQRQERLLSGQPGVLWAVIDEAVLRRRIAYPAVMRQQLEHLRKLSEPERIRVHILPLTAAQHSAASSFIYLTFPGGTGKDAAYIDTAAGGVWFEDEAATDRIVMAWEQMLQVVPSIAKTPEILQTIVEEL